MATQPSPTTVATANDILTERSGAVLTIQLNRPTKKNAMTSSMYVNSITLENENFSARLASAEAKEALGAFLGKRASR